MCLGFYRPQKDLSWAENQTFKVAEIYATFAPFLHGVQGGLYKKKKEEESFEISIYAIRIYNCNNLKLSH